MAMHLSILVPSPAEDFSIILMTQKQKDNLLTIGMQVTVCM